MGVIEPHIKITVSIVGGSGYTGGELLRLLLFHPYVCVQQVTSEHNAGKSVSRIHPNLRKITDIKFCSIQELKKCDLLFLCLPHGQSMKQIGFFRDIAPRIIDLSSDFRLKNQWDYNKWYDTEHPYAELLKEFVYGIPELHREEMRKANYISSAGCNATAVILALYPLFHSGLIEPCDTVVEVKAGTSQGGNQSSPASHHPQRSHSIRSYMPAGHRHIAEMLQELKGDSEIAVHFSATSIDMVRGIHAVCHTFLKNSCDEKSIWKLYREYYGKEPFIRIVNERDGLYPLPDPKIVTGTNYCDIGFVRDIHSNRLIVYSAIDNLVKGASGQAVQAFNIMYGFEETVSLTFPGFHPL